MDRIKRWVEEAITAGYEYEVYVEKRRKTTVESSDETLENLIKSEDAGIGIRVFKDKKMGFSYTTDLTESSLKDCVRFAMQACNVTPEDEGFSVGNCKSWGTLDTYYDKEGVEKPVEEKIELVIDLERRAKSLDSRVRGVRKTSLKEIELEVICFNSCQLYYTYRGTWYTSMIAVLTEEDGDQSISYEFVGSRRLSELPLQEMLQEVVFKATATLKPSSIHTKKMPIILYRDASAMILEAFSPLFLGDYLVKGKTFLKGMEGEPIFSEKLTIVDDGSMKGGFLSLPVDAEGHPTQKNVLVEKGRFIGFLHSTYTALKSGANPTGNSVRDSFKSPPSSGITNLYIEPGEYSLEEMLQKDEVFLITDLMGLHTVDPVSGNFSLGASGIIYRGGKREKSVRGVVIGGNIKELWGAVVEVGKDLRFYGNTGSPSLYIENITVGG
ncbi:MAG: TldD/PmbA family protein [Aquificaceae bacterium]|nr:TldD/PmbA family protein [Aquificaceae bacterium]